MATVEFRGVSKSYGAYPVLEALDLEIDHGEFVVLLGPSGCGKTTLLNIIAGLVEQTSGQVFIDGRDVSFFDPKDRGIAMVFQSYALYPTKSVRGNLKFGLDARGISRDEIQSRITWVAKLLQIEALLDRKPAELSGGQRQRVAIGRALVKRVDVCLFDEPLSNLDAKLRTEMRMEIKNLHAQLHNTVIYVTHDQIEAMTMATKIAVMNKGVIQQIGTPDEIYHTPNNLFVAGFVGSPSMNFIDLDVRHDGGGLAAVEPASGLAFDLARANLRETPANGRRVRVGIRPEHLRVGEANGDTSPCVRMQPKYFEKLGPEAIAFLSFRDQVIAVRVAPAAIPSLQEASDIPVTFPIDRVSVFDAETGKRL
jgi:multiple sugar transport system ATP-binding protein